MLKTIVGGLLLANLTRVTTWPPALVFIGVGTILVLLPARYTLIPAGHEFATVIFGFVIPIATALIVGLPQYRRYERKAAFGLAMLTSVITVTYLCSLLNHLVHDGPSLNGNSLLHGSISVWVCIVGTFSLWYWLMGTTGRIDFLFPQRGSPDFPDWHPKFIDYFAIAFSTSTAFSATDVAPATSRAKVLMMLQSALSLIIVLVAAARAINIL